MRAWQRSGRKQPMTLDSETLALARTLAISFPAVLLITQICRECGANALRMRLHVLDAELFEFARRGRAGTGEPAYAMLRDSIRSMIWFSHRISLTQHLATVLFNRPPVPTQFVERYSRKWTVALAQVRNDVTRADLADLHERLLIEVSGYITLGAVPLASALSNAIPLGSVFDSCHRFALRNASLVEAQARYEDRLPAAA